MEMISLAVLEVYKFGDVSEETYDNYNLPIYYDYDGNKWYLKSNADHFARSKAFHHHSGISKKRGILYRV